MTPGDRIAYVLGGLVVGGVWAYLLAFYFGAISR